MTARDEVLARIRQALGPDPTVPPIPREYRRGGSSTARAERLDLFAHRLHDYKAQVTRCSAAELPAAIREAVTGRVLLPPTLPWPVDGTVDDGFDATELDDFDTTVTACAAACAETGTIVLDASPDQGRRALSLMPDRLVCVVLADQVVDTVPELVARLDPARPLTLISGPSATSDIELQRVEGVHGPRELHVILVDDADAPEEPS